MVFFFKNARFHLIKIAQALPLQERSLSLKSQWENARYPVQLGGAIDGNPLQECSLSLN